MQARLLRVIQEQEITKVGGSGGIRVNVRIISATNRNLPEEIASGTFRQDLFYRLNVFPIHVPPLRERREDIIPLASYFMRRIARERNVAEMTFSEETRHFLESSMWPGNVRELKNMIERAMVRCEGNVITIADLVFDGPDTADSPVFDDGTLAGLEKQEILKVLRQFDGHREKAARHLGINRKTLREKINRYGLDEYL